MKETFTKQVFRFALYIVMLTTANDVFAQQTVRGTVLSEADEGMPGVNVVLKGTSNGTTTDADGKFSISVPGSESVLVISFVGYIAEEVAVGNQSEVNVKLTPDIASLQEVVVIGYGTQRKQDVTTAVAQVKPNEFVPGAVRNAGELLRGKVAGLTLSTSSGDPDASTEILLRGITSIYGSSSPLVLVDGYPGDMNSISPNDIESIDVLKDASASAIYGTRGKNGVILITTKKAKAGLQPVVEYSGYIATESFNRKADFMNAADVRARIGEGLIEGAYDKGSSTDWLDEISRAPINHFHNISLRSGTERTQYAVNASYQLADGMFLGSDNEEFKLRMDITQYLIADKLKMNVNVLKGLQKYGGFNGWIYRQALIRNPTSPVTDGSGNWTEEPAQFQYENPLALIKEQVYDNNSQWTWLTGSVSYFPVDNLELKIVGSQHQWSNETGTYQTKKHISNIRDTKNGVAFISNSSTVENYLDLTADYTKVIGRHRISGLLGYSYIDFANGGSSMSNFNFPTDDFSYHSIELGRALKENQKAAFVDSYQSDWKLIGFFGRVGYGFADKYNILASLRYEGSSRFGSNHKWGLFPALSAGWTISNEDFMSDVTIVNTLKLRAGYGRTGSISTNPYESLTRYAYSSDNFYFNGKDWISILEPVGNPNPDLGWETNIEYNIGLDYSILNNKISGAIDYYHRTLEDLIFQYPVPVPPNLVGFTRANAATMTNRGVEITLNIIPIHSDKFEWTTSLNYSLNKNKLTSLSNEKFKVENDFFFAGYTGDPIQLSTHKIQEGKAIGSFFGYKSVGLEEVPDKAGKGKWLVEGENGEIKSIEDVTDDDRQILGNGLPQWYLAWNNYLRYGNFDMSITMRGAFDYQILNFQRMFYENPTITYNKLRSAYDKIDGLTLASPQSYVSYYIEDGDFWKIDNVTIGYNINTSDAKMFRKARVYVSGSNLATITGYKGIDPEVTRLGLAPGNDDRDKYPTTRTFSLGVNLTF